MYLHIDERTDILVSLSVCLNCLKQVQSEPLIWKWAVLSLHSALQGSMVCHLSGTAEVGALSKKSIDNWSDWHELDRQGKHHRESLGIDEIFGVPKNRLVDKESRPPESRLADPKTLFKRLYQSKRKIEPAGEILEISTDQRESFRILNNLRTGLTHFAPKGWSIELTGLPAIFLELLDVIEAISQDPWPFRHMGRDDRKRLTVLISELREELNQIPV